jgi:hypothetical protein
MTEKETQRPDIADVKYPTAAWDPATRSRLAVAEVLADDRWRRIKVPPPDANDSPETRQELDDLVALQEKTEDRARRKDDIAKQKNDIITPFARVLLRESELEDERKDRPLLLFFPPRSRELAEGMKELVRYVIAFYKAQFNRPRPFQIDARIKPMIADPGHPAYPSGHSTQVHLIALVLSEVLPHARGQLMEVAKEVATNREWAGVHYPSDTAAGLELAKELLPLVKEPFRDAIEAAKLEWVAFRPPSFVTAAAQRHGGGGGGASEQEGRRQP